MIWVVFSQVVVLTGIFAFRHLSSQLARFTHSLRPLMWTDVASSTRIHIWNLHASSCVWMTQEALFSAAHAKLHLLFNSFKQSFSMYFLYCINIEGLFHCVSHYTSRTDFGHWHLAVMQTTLPCNSTPLYLLKLSFVTLYLVLTRFFSILFLCACISLINALCDRSAFLFLLCAPYAAFSSVL